MVEIRPKRSRVSSPSNGAAQGAASADSRAGQSQDDAAAAAAAPSKPSGPVKSEGPKSIAGGLLGLAYESSDED